MSIRAFQGEKDNRLSIGGQKGLIHGLKKMHGEVRFTVLANRDHFILDTCEDQEFYSWFLEHRRGHRVRFRYTDSETQLEGAVRIETSFRQPPDASDLTLKNGIRAYKINKLFIQKTIAFYERTAVRDFYDLAFLLS